MAFIYETADCSDYDLLKEFAKENRHKPTLAEDILWNAIKAGQIGFKFRRQHIVGNYIADFACLHYKLIIEVDGIYHFKDGQIVKDKDRTIDLESLGFHVIRFTNDEIVGNIDNVTNRIKEEIMKETKKSSPLLTFNSSDTSSSFDDSQREAALPPLSGRVGERLGWAVDAACSGNPGPMEYRGIDLATGQQLFHFGPMHGTNNIGEFLAIVHALALMDKKGIHDKVIYSDSHNAILWVKKKQCKTKLERNAKTAALYDIIVRAENWLRLHNVTTPILKWETAKWGEVPADFGRK
jgi:very-short-patch-repair endonuclease/viroplasmin and RNaseH domain-containing protein